MVKKVVLGIPVYNSEATLTRTLETLVNQDYPIFKIKVFDNQSTDNSQKIVLDFQKRYPFIELNINEVNVGAEGNFTCCIQAAEGDYCALVHSDDLYEKDFVSKSVAALENNPQCVAAFCGALEINDQEKVTGSRFVPNELTKNDVTVLNAEELSSLVFKYGNFVTCPSVFARSNSYCEKIKTWNGREFKSSADLDVWLRLSQMGSFAFIRKELIRYRVSEASYSYRIAKKRTTKHDIFLVLDRYKNEKNISDYNFLALKDQAIRSLNMIRNKSFAEPFPCEVKFDLGLVWTKMCQSKWHFKMGVAIIGIHFLTKWYSRAK